tara:strand:+ start:2825 stop:3040 length:216 start_codon:yes stop_codon:yes gene_type:complete
MGNKKDMIWRIEIFTTKEKNELLKTYELTTMNEIAYILNMKSALISNYYHKLIKPRGVLEYINISQKQLVF